VLDSTFVSEMACNYDATLDGFVPVFFYGCYWSRCKHLKEYLPGCDDVRTADG
jgi:hypothetical protein